MTKESGLKELDPVLCVSKEARVKLQKELKNSIIPVHGYWKHGYLFSSSEADPHHVDRIAGDEGPSKFMADIGIHGYDLDYAKKVKPAVSD
jgi:hypothetical protein